MNPSCDDWERSFNEDTPLCECDVSHNLEFNDLNINSNQCEIFKTQNKNKLIDFNDVHVAKQPKALGE